MPSLTAALGARVAAAERCVVFTGAGISAESGIGTFRSTGGHWQQFRPEDLATPEAFARDPQLVWRWYRWRFGAIRAARPNPGHLAIAGLERAFPSLRVVTQNVDRLHQRAGSSEVLELHGTIWESFCSRCGKRVATETLNPEIPVPSCSCRGRLRPAVVWFGERLDPATFAAAEEAVGRADLLLVVGTSAVVWPAAGLVELGRSAGAMIVEANPEETPASELADLVLRGPAGETLPGFVVEAEAWRSPS